MDVCIAAGDDDHARLLGSIRPGLNSFEGSGFLAWGPAAEPDLEQVLADLDPMLTAAGERGCAFEASLESWYRFLIDPEPPAAIVVTGGATFATAQGVDEVVLEQRAAFLRPDSVLAIVLLTDENDCSVQDENYGWLVARRAPMYRSSPQCLLDPNDRCCQSCADTLARDGCPPLASNAECAAGNTLTPGNDDLNLRCWDQKRRFGVDLLYPIARYRDALTSSTVLRRSTGELVANPLFAGSERQPSQVILTGIVGVPWQDLADPASLTGEGLTYLTAAELTEKGRWDLLLGNPEASPPVRPADPFMLETPDDRSTLGIPAANPLVDERLVPSTSADPGANGINGHESANVGNRTLQPTCIFPRATPKVCDQEARAADESCYCFDDDQPFNYPACQPPGGGAASTTQYFEMAYPGLRHLQLLKALGDNAVTASICPKILTPDAADYGYRPAMKALAQRLERAFNP